MIILLHPRAVRPKNRRFPLAILSIAAVLEGKEEYAIVDGNLDPAPGDALDRIVRTSDVELLAVSVMPGPQMVSAIPLCREFRRKHPSVPIVWGGYFPSLYTDASLNAEYVDFAIRGQGEDTLLELLAALRHGRKFPGIRGLSYKDDFGLHVHNTERPLRSPNDFPWMPYHRLDSMQRYLLPTFLGRRTAVHQASIGCPFRCQFCGVVPIFDGRQKTEAPERTAAILTMLQQRYGIDAVQFYDNNFFLNESHAREQAERIEPLNLRWWCEGRIDTVLRYSDQTLAALRRSGSVMIFFGAESGSDKILLDMNKRITTGQTLELAARLREFRIVPEFSFVVGNPQDPEFDTRQTFDFIRRIKRLNPSAEIIVQHYIPTPHPDGMYGHIDDKIDFPRTPDEWATERWYNFTTRNDPRLPWLPGAVKRRIDNFELVINSRWPTIQDIHLERWGPPNAAVAEQLALCARCVRISRGAPVRTATGGASKAAAGELVTRLSAGDGYRVWAPHYDEHANPVLGLETRVLRPRLGELRGKRVLDVATGTGRWMEYTAAQGRNVYGIDLCSDMLRQGTKKPKLSGRLIRADLRRLPFRESAVDLALCCFALGYVPSVDVAFLEMARVARFVIVSDLHPAAVRAGWTRSFRTGGQVFEIEQHPHSEDALTRAALAAGLVQRWRIDAHFEEPERGFFIRAGKQNEFAAAASIPAVLITAWSKP